MEELKCVSCGGKVDINKVDINEELMIGICQYCGTEQPLPEEIIKNIKQKKKELQTQATAERRDKFKKKIKKVMKIIIPSLAVLIAFIIIFLKVILPSFRYNNAMNYYNDKNYIKAAVLFTELEDYKDSSSMNKESNYLQAEMYFNAKNYTNAIILFDKLGTYKDSNSMVTECNYMIANQYLENKQYRNAILLFEKLGSYKDSSALFNKYKLYELNIGDIVYYGKYEQDNNLNNGKEPIQWTVLAVDENKALLISCMGLDNKSYDTTNSTVTWETCTLRKWLNNNFLNAAFTSNEQKRIVSIKLKTEDSYKYNLNGGNDTIDKVFLLSGREVTLYFPEEKDRILTVTEYAYNLDEHYKPNHTFQWWLRTTSTGVDLEGDIGYYVGDNEYVFAVRPAIWIKLDATE